MSVRLVDHHFARTGEPLPEVDDSLLYDYIVAGNGTFVRGRRPGLEVRLPYSSPGLNGLANIFPYVRFDMPRVPVARVERMLELSREVCTPSPVEALFHLYWSPLACAAAHQDALASNGWVVEFPEQRATADSVEPLQTGAGTSTERALIEVHSHHSMAAGFSAADDRDERQGFRIYAVLGRIFDQPEIIARVGMFGHMHTFPASLFFDLPEGMVDCGVD